MVERLTSRKLLAAIQQTLLSTRSSGKLVTAELSRPPDGIKCYNFIDNCWSRLSKALDLIAIRQEKKIKSLQHTGLYKPREREFSRFIDLQMQVPRAICHICRVANHNKQSILWDWARLNELAVAALESYNGSEIAPIWLLARLANLLVIHAHMLTLADWRHRHREPLGLHSSC